MFQRFCNWLAQVLETDDDGQGVCNRLIYVPTYFWAVVVYYSYYPAPESDSPTYD